MNSEILLPRDLSVAYVILYEGMEARREGIRKPFHDSHGRLGWVLTKLLLLQFGYAYVPYSSLESVVEQSKELLCRPRQTHATIRELSQLRAVAALFTLFDQHERVLATLPVLSIQIVGQTRSHGRVTMGELIRLTGSSHNTLKEHFAALLEKRHLAKHKAEERNRVYATVAQRSSSNAMLREEESCQNEGIVHLIDAQIAQLQQARTVFASARNTPQEPAKRRGRPKGTGKKAVKANASAPNKFRQTNNDRRGQSAHCRRTENTMGGGKEGQRTRSTRRQQNHLKAEAR